jgi:hypothetical protein
MENFTILRLKNSDILGVIRLKCFQVYFKLIDLWIIGKFKAFTFDFINKICLTLIIFHAPTFMEISLAATGMSMVPPAITQTTATMPIILLREAYKPLHTIIHLPTLTAAFPITNL